jgi:hypothetical protein
MSGDGDEDPEHVRLLAELADARADAERARDRLTFLLEVSRSVAHTRDHAEILQRVLDLAVPRIADGGLGMLPEADGLRRVALAHRDESAAALGREHVLGTLVPYDGAGVGAVCFRTGEMQQQRAAEIADIDVLPPFIRRTVQGYGLRAWVAVPILAGGETLGVLTLGFDDPAVLEHDDDVALVLGLAGRTASGLIEAALLEHEREVAMILQRSVLPASLPAVAGLDIAARYLPAEVDVNVGGDWYDAFVLPDGRVAVTVGDVSGHGLASGATMGQLRNALRAYALEGHGPSQVLSRLNDLLVHTVDDECASVVHAVVDPRTGAVDWASAGHLPMVHVRVDGNALAEEPHGVLLGAIHGLPFPESRLQLELGDALVLYTDGLVERRGRDLGDAITALSSSLDAAHDSSAEALCDLALTALEGSALDDDVCVLVLSRQGTAGTAGDVPSADV